MFNGFNLFIAIYYYSYLSHRCGSSQLKIFVRLEIVGFYVFLSLFPRSFDGFCSEAPLSDALLDGTASTASCSAAGLIHIGLHQ